MKAEEFFDPADTQASSRLPLDMVVSHSICPVKPASAAIMVARLQIVTSSPAPRLTGRLPLHSVGHGLHGFDRFTNLWLFLHGTFAPH